MSLTVTPHAGPEAAAWTDAIARLRIEVFREYPYLYEGSLEYERHYLQSYFRSPRAVCVLARDGEAIVGASTGIPLADEDRTFAEPFLKTGHHLGSVFYFGESVLLPRYRGKGLGHRFFDEREAWARKMPGLRWTTFCAIDRPSDHPAKPAGYVPHDRFWTKRGYTRRPELRVEFSWKEVGEAEETLKPLTYWTREWPG